MPVTSPTDPPPSPARLGRRGSLELGLALHGRDRRLARVSEPALRGSPDALGIQLEQRLLEPAGKIVALARHLELGHRARAYERVVLVREGAVLDPFQLRDPFPFVERLSSQAAHDRRDRVTGRSELA